MVAQLKGSVSSFGMGKEEAEVPVSLGPTNKQCHHKLDRENHYLNNTNKKCLALTMKRTFKHDSYINGHWWKNLQKRGGANK